MVKTRDLRTVAGAIMMVLMCLATAGCDGSFGTGGTGEMVVPQQTLRQIGNTEMEAIATTQPTTMPATLPAMTRTAQPPAEILLSIEEVRRVALVNNLDLRVELLNPTIAKESVNAERARFESVFTASTDYSVTDTPAASKLSGTQGKDLRTNAGIQVPLRTGGQLNFDVPLTRSETNNTWATLNPAYTSDVAASISHPLLRGAGLDVNAQPIRVAFYQYQTTEVRTKLEVIRVLAEADRVYWRLYAARGALEVRKKEYDLANAQLERARRMVEAGAAAETEVTRAESGVADRLEGIIVADNAVRQRERDLKRILNRPDIGMDSPTIVVPASKPNPLYYRLDAQQLVRVAINQRMDMLETELQIALEAANVRSARNAMLPLVTLDYAYNISGLGPDLGDSLRMTRDKDYEDHRLGVRMEVPIGNEAARSRLRASLARRMQQIATKQQRATLVEQEVLNAIDQIEANYQRIWAAQKRVLMSTRVVDLETRHFSQGLRTSTDVLDAQTKLANAQLSEVSAITEYQIAQVDIAYATGTLLGATRVVWQPIAGPKP